MWRESGDIFLTFVLLLAMMMMMMYVSLNRWYLHGVKYHKNNIVKRKIFHPVHPFVIIETSTDLVTVRVTLTVSCK
jgi:hypothetical protein